MNPKDNFSAIRRLLVLMPDVDFNLANLARRVAEITSLENVTLVFIANTADPKEEYRARRRLATLAALMRDGCARVETHFTLDQNWARILNAIYQRGDVIVCQAEQSGRNGSSLHNELEDLLKAPVYVIGGLYPQNQNKNSSVASTLFNVVAPALIILVFLVIQVSIDRVTAGLLHALLLSVSVVAEYGALVLWNLASSAT